MKLIKLVSFFSSFSFPNDLPLSLSCCDWATDTAREDFFHWSKSSPVISSDTWLWDSLFYENQN